SVQINWDQPVEVLHNFIRGNDKLPGAWTTIDGQQVTVLGSTIFKGAKPKGQEVEVTGMSQPGIVHKGGLILTGNDGNMVRTSNTDVTSLDTNMQLQSTVVQSLVFNVSRNKYKEKESPLK
ncbi:cytosolic 10-formyltetrahydrofolate dehydrogenase-like, partial [Anneissia japonica]|uniref:cytosolic 10-formyltetrahydrofolate dehydrogenase-like n=1 Tax=Anneissia japonica TaxID=1529436 RepID=UPI0014259AC5